MSVQEEQLTLLFLDVSFLCRHSCHCDFCSSAPRLSESAYAEDSSGPPTFFRNCAFQRTCGRAFLELRILKELRRKILELRILKELQKLAAARELCR